MASALAGDRLGQLAARARRLGRRLGLDVSRYTPGSSPDARRLRMIQVRAIDVVLDVGANRGHYARDLRRAGYGGRIVSFEPLSAAYAQLQRASASDPRWECRQVALGEAEGTVELNIAGNLYSSSLLPMTGRHVDSAPESAYVGRETVRKLPLDALAAELIQPGEHALLKLDVQGYEAAVLQGAAEALGHVEAIECELSLTALYQGAPLLEEMLHKLQGLGFRLAGIDAAFSDPHSGELLQADGMFVRDRPTGDG